MVTGEDDSYYGSSSLKQAYKTLCDIYKEQGINDDAISELVVLDVKDAFYFAERGIEDQHGGGFSFAHEQEIMGWLFGEHEATERR